MNITLILSGGSGVRFGSGTPKQYYMLMGKEVIAYSIDASLNSNLMNETIIIAGTQYVERLSGAYGVTCIEGGASRNESLKKGLDYINVTYPSCEKVFINEAVRPFLTTKIIDEYYSYLDEYDAVITTQHITDSLGRDGEAVTMRDEYYLIQAPEAFRFDYLYRHFSAESTITATVQQLPDDRKVLKYFDFRHNMKITYKEDLLHAEQILRLYYGNSADNER
ncbi:MAG: 2-C-methyl-D-erythritol 4-phosphate cytidylyltransferase [Oscillospiraceae bacterium]|nr:2-C-methyl-D-erythritol 4-phosphate cytidylyltransferase [Oscillospiraceae bacterium]